MNMKMRLVTGLVAGCLAAVSLTGCGGGTSTPPATDTSAPPATTSTTETTPPNTNMISLLIGASAGAELDAVKAAAAAWTAQSGIPTEVIGATDFDQESAQGFASGQPADLMYLSTSNLVTWSANGSIEAYGDKLSNIDDFYPALKADYIIDGTLWGAPKDFSTLALVINTDMWTAAGLTDADVPTTWDQLETIAGKLTTKDHVGICWNGELARIGVFFAQAGGGIETADGKADANSDANVAALTYVQKLMKEGYAASAADVGAGWGGEGFGTGKCAMTIEGNWITGAMSTSYTNINYKAVELPAGVQKGTLEFSNAWGLATDGDNKDNAINLVEFLTSTDQQLAFAKAFGVMPSVQSASAGYTSQFPEMSAFMAGAAYATSLPSQAGVSDVINDFNSSLANLKTADPKALLDTFQQNLQAVLG